METIQVTLTKYDIFCLIRGLPVPYGGFEPFTKFTGNQWNENWEWDLSKFQDMEIEPLWVAYTTLKKKVMEWSKNDSTNY